MSRPRPEVAVNWMEALRQMEDGAEFAARLKASGQPISTTGG